MHDYSGYKWIKVKHFKFDESASLQENFDRLQQHHVEETTFLINKVRELAELLNRKEAEDEGKAPQV